MALDAAVYWLAMTGRWAMRGPVAGVALGLAFVALSLVTRLPYQDRTLFISDSVRYALALERYDMTAGRPHPPGNPVYVGCIAFLDRLLGDPVTALAVFSALASGVAFLFAYLLARDLAGETAGWLAAALLAVSPLFWFFGGVGMPAAGEAALALIVAWMVRRARAPVETGWFWAMTATLALAFGYRSTFAILMAPLWIYAAWRHPWRRIAGGAALVAVTAVLWTGIVATLSGGWAAYRQTTAAFLSEVVLATKILGGGFGKIPVQATDIAASAVLGLGLFLLPLVVGLVGCFTGREPFPEAAPFMAAWALPMTLFHLAYDWAPRFGVLLMAPAVVLAAATAVPLAQWIVRGRRSATRPDLPPGPLPRALVVLALAVNLGLFLLPVRIGPWTLPEPYPSGARLLDRNDDLSRRDAAIRGAFDPDTTLILAYDHAFHAAYFLPEYRVVGLFPLFSDAADAWVPSARGRIFSFEPGSDALPAVDPLPLPAEIERVVIYDDGYLDFWPRRTLPLSPLPYDLERRLSVAALPAGGGCLDFGFRQLVYHTGDAPECATGLSARR
jgi:hypothetical protein